MILPLPRTGPSRRCRLQLTTKIRLSRFSRLASDSAPRLSGSSHSPSPRKAHTRRLAGVAQLAVEQVAVVARLVQRGDRAESHADGGELPELGHQPRVRVARQTPRRAADLAAEVVEVVGLEAALEEGAGVDARGGVALEVDVVAGGAAVLAAEEVVEADLVQRGRAGVGGEVAADAVGGLVRLHHHHRRVPADVGADAPLDELVAGEPRLGLAGDRVDVRGRHGRRKAHLRLAGAVEQRREQIAGAGLAVGVDDGVERVEPFLRLDRIGVGQLVDVAVEDHASSLAPPAAVARRTDR